MSRATGSTGIAAEILVVDASVVIKWHVNEIQTEAALRLLEDDVLDLHAPDLMLPEVGNILWKKVGRAELTEARAREITGLVAMLPVQIHPAGPILEAAFEIAMRSGRTVYDSLYVSLAVQLNGRLVTADEKLFNALKEGPLGPHLLWIEDIPRIASVDDSEGFVLSVK